MTDVLTKQQRSANMSAIKGKGNKSTELKFLKILKEKKITGWRRNYKRVKGNPDFVFLQKKMAIFLDGCFWHGCPDCYKPPMTNPEFWELKITNNKERDSRISHYLHQRDWIVVRIWEHELKDIDQSFVYEKKLAPLLS